MPGVGLRAISEFALELSEQRPIRGEKGPYKGKDPKTYRLAVDDEPGETLMIDEVTAHSCRAVLIS